MPTEAFVDTSFILALASHHDRHHEESQVLLQWVSENKIRLVCSRAVLIEVGDFLARKDARLKAVQILEDMEADPDIEIIPLTERLYSKAFELYRKRPDKPWGLTDCLSFEIMRERGISDALSTDEHLEQAGFRALLRE